MRLFLTFIILLLMFASCKKESSSEKAGSHNMNIRFRARAGDSLLSFGKTYLNAFNETFSIKTFKCYIHGVKLSNTDSSKSSELMSANYYLLNFADSNSTLVKLDVEPSVYNLITFVIGVDSIKNVSGAQTDALDPANGMFWTWSTGYIMAKLEGNSPSALTPGNLFEYHIGGYGGTNKVQRYCELRFPLGAIYDLKAGRRSEITIDADVNTWFINPNDISIRLNPVCTTEGPLAKKIADNYSKMFSIRGVKVY